MGVSLSKYTGLNYSEKPKIQNLFCIFFILY
uniref:Uncharacterized protein n=1 Tax=Anguilla anguilla TaxID=7936 RepID=A0A0E9RJF5_ANGAN